jgi:hypothetical protein
MDQMFKYQSLDVHLAFQCFETDYGAPKYNLELEIHESERSKSFLIWLNKIENTLSITSAENAMDIFGKEMGREQIQDMFRSNLKEDRFRVKDR